MNIMIEDFSKSHGVNLEYYPMAQKARVMNRSSVGCWLSQLEETPADIALEASEAKHS